MTYDPAEVRQWASENGIDVAERGRVPAGVVAAWEAATGAAPPADDGPDFDRAAVIMGADVLADREPAQDTEDGSDPPAAEPRTGPLKAAGVASLREARERLGGGAPKRPGWAGQAKDTPPPAGAKRSRSRSKTATARPQASSDVIEITPEVINDMGGKLALLLTPVAAAWSASDPVCGGAFTDNMRPIIEAALPVMAQSQAVVRFFAKSSGVFALFGLATACAPVASAVYEHHFSKEAAERKKAEAAGVRPGHAGPAPDDVLYPARPVAGHVPAYRTA